jgi:hypothetical protein
LYTLHTLNTLNTLNTIKGVIKLNKLDLIILIDLMVGLTKEEYEKLKEKSLKEVEKIYINAYQQQDDEQINICYE